MPGRPTPFSLVFERAAEDRFPAIRASLARGGADPFDRDAFLLDPEVVRLLRDLVPVGGVGEAIDHHVALLHHAYLTWLGGTRVFRLGREEAVALLADGGTPAGAPRDAGAPPAAYYIQFPERLIWAQIVEGHSHEPLDGLFVLPGERLRVLGIFGLHPDREGFSAVEAEGPRPVGLAREDGTPLFAPVLPGGERARLYSITGAEELLELGARTIPSAARASTAP